MKDLVKTMIEHPFASMFIIWATAGAVSDVIRSFTAKGPKTVVTINKPEKKES